MGQVYPTKKLLQPTQRSQLIRGSGSDRLRLRTQGWKHRISRGLLRAFHNVWCPTPYETRYRLDSYQSLHHSVDSEMDTADPRMLPSMHLVQ